MHTIAIIVTIINRNMITAPLMEAAIITATLLLEPFDVLVSAVLVTGFDGPSDVPLVSVGMWSLIGSPN